MEFPAIGGILTNWVVRTAKLLRYVSDYDFFVASMEVLFCVFIIYFTIEEFLCVKFSLKL